MPSKISINNHYCIEFLEFDKMYYVGWTKLCKKLYSFLLKHSDSDEYAKTYFTDMFNKNSILFMLYNAKDKKIVSILNIEKTKYYNHVLLLNIKSLVIHTEYRNKTIGWSILFAFFFVYKKVLSEKKTYFYTVTKNTRVISFLNTMFIQNNLKNISNIDKGDFQSDFNLFLSYEAKKFSNNNLYYIDGFILRKFQTTISSIKIPKSSLGKIELGKDEFVLFFGTFQEEYILKNKLYLFAKRKFKLQEVNDNNLYINNFFIKDSNKVCTNNHPIIALIDSGVCPDLFANKFVHEVNLKYDDSSKKIMYSKYFIDDIGHGTYMLKIINELTSNLATILPIKAVHTNKTLGNTKILIKAIDWAIKHKSKLINISASVLKSQNIKELKNICEKAKKNKIIIVCALNIDCKQKSYPFSFNSTIGVGIRPYEGILFFQKENNIVRTHFDYAGLKGSSCATAKITGLLYNYILQHPHITFDKAVSYLQKISIPLSDPLWNKKKEVSYEK